MRPKEFAILSGIHASRVSRLAKQCRILQNPRSKEIVVDHPLTRGFLLSRMSIMRAEIQGFLVAPPGWKMVSAIIDGRMRTIVAWPDIPDGGKFAQWFIEAEIDTKKMTAKIGSDVFPLTVERGE